MAAIIQKGKDALAGSLAECYITIDGNRYNFMQMFKFEAKVEKNSVEVPILGKPGKGNKSTGWKGTWSGTAHYNQSIVREMELKYMETGEETYFEIQISNDDPTSAAGRQTVVFMDCKTDGGILAMFDAGSDTLQEDLSGTFERCSMPESFQMLDGMQ